MAGIVYSVSSGAQSLSAATAATAVQLLAASNQRLKIKGVSVSFNGTSATAEPVAVRLVRQTTAGTMSAGNKRVLNAAPETPQSTATVNATVNPTSGDILHEWHVHPQAGLTFFFPADQTPEVPGGGRVGVELTAPATVTARTTVTVEE